MKKSMLRFVVSTFFAAMAGSLPTHAQLPYTVSWVGNTWEAASTNTPPSLHMQYQINGMYVNASNGTVYTNSYYDEDGEECGVYQGGNYVGQLANLGAYRRGGGVGVTTDGANYIFITMSQGGNYSPGVLNARGNLDYPDQVFTNTNNAYGQAISAITFTAAVPSNIIVGSVMTSGTGIALGTTVTAISGDRKTLTLSKNTTATGAANQTLYYMGTYANAAYSAGDNTLSFSTIPPGIVVGSYFTGGTGLSEAAKVTAINGNTVTLSRPMTDDGAAGQLLTFGETWYCIRRYSLTLSGTTFNTAPVTTGTSAYGWDSTMAIVSTVNDVAGLAYANSKLYASDPINNRILIYSPTDLSLTGSFAITSPGPIAADSSGNLWIIQGGNSVVHYSSTGTNLNNTITSSSVAVPVSVSYDATGSRLLVADNGPDQQVKIFTTLTGTNPTVSSTFGTKLGFNASPAGVVGDLKFAGLAGAGADSSGNIYVGCNEFNNYGNMLPGGAELKSFPAGGSTATWKLFGLQFENIADFDPYTGGADIQSTDGHYTMNYAQPAGQQWTYYGFSLNPTLTGSYSQDARLNVAPTSVMLRRVNGKKIQYEVDQGESSVYIYRFSGERAIPSGIIARNNLEGQFVDYPTSIPAWPPNQPAGAWIWCDLNANGLMDATGGEYTGTGTNDPASWGSWVDHDGDVWVAYTGTSGIRRFLFQSLDSHGNPLYIRDDSNSAHSILYSTPPLFTDVERMQYDSESDSMYITGYTAAKPYTGQWGVLGTVLAKYTNWTTTPTGTITPLYTISLPWNPGATPPVFAKSFTVAGEKIFVGDVKTATIGVYSSLTGTLLQTLTPAGSSSQLDSVQSLNSIETNGDQYLVLANENLHGKNYLYQVGGNVTVTTYNGNDSTNNTYAGGANYNNNNNNVGVGAATFLSNKGSVTFNNVNVASAGSYQLRIDGANGDNTNRNITISANGTTTSLKCPSTGSWSTFCPMWTTVTLNAGNNPIKLFGNGVSAPDIAHVAVAPSQ